VSESHLSGVMAEIALALAMAFFAVLVLALMSMGVPETADAVAAPTRDRSLEVARAEAGGGAPAPARPETLIIHHRGRFLDARLKPVDPAALPPDSRLVLAIAPDTAMAEAIAVRARIARPDVTVTALDQRWLNALKDLKELPQ